MFESTQFAKALERPHLDRVQDPVLGGTGGDRSTGRRVICRTADDAITKGQGSAASTERFQPGIRLIDLARPATHPFPCTYSLPETSSGTSAHTAVFVQGRYFSYGSD